MQGDVTSTVAWLREEVRALRSMLERLLQSDGSVKATSISGTPIHTHAGGAQGGLLVAMHQMVFQPEAAALSAATLLPPQLCAGEPGEHGVFTAIRAKASAGTAGSGTNTILIEADDNPAFSSATTLFTLALNAATEVDDTSLDNPWAAGDNWIRARCSAVGTAPQNVVVEFFFEQRVQG